MWFLQNVANRNFKTRNKIGDQQSPSEWVQGWQGDLFKGAWIWASIQAVSAHRVVKDTLRARFSLLSGSTIFRNHFPSSLIVDEFNLRVAVAVFGIVKFPWQNL